MQQEMEQQQQQQQHQQQLEGVNPEPQHQETPNQRNDNNNNNNNNNNERARIPFQPKPVLLTWDDFVCALEELEHLSQLRTVTQSLAIFSFGCTAFCQAQNVQGKVLSIDAEMENLKQKGEERPRILERALRLSCRMLKQDEEGVSEQVFSHFIDCISELYYTENSPIIQTMRSFFYSEVLPTLRFVVDEVKLIGPHFRVKLCHIIQELEDFEQQMKQLLTNEDYAAVTTLIKNTTHNVSDQIHVMGKLVTILKVTSLNDILVAFNLFEELPLSVLNNLLDLIQIAQIRQFKVQEVVQIVRTMLEILKEWDEDKSFVLAKMLELARVMIAHGTTTSKVIIILTESVFKALCLLPATLSKTFTAKSACNLIELFILADEQNINLMLIRDCVIPQIFHVTQHMSDKETVLKEAFTFATYAIGSKNPVPYMTECLNSVLNFIRNGLGEDFVNDSQIFATTLELASLFVRMKAEVKGLPIFFESHMSSCYKHIVSWPAENQQERRELFIDILKLAIAVVPLGINRYKYFVFYMPPIFKMINTLELRDDERHPTLSTQHAKIKILKNILSILKEELKNGHDIEVLLSDGIPLILELHGADTGIERHKRLIIIDTTNNTNNVNTNTNTNTNTNDQIQNSMNLFHGTTNEQLQPQLCEEKYTPTPTEVIQMLKHVVNKFETNGDYGLVLLLKWALDYALSQFHFVTQSQIAQVFRTLIRKGKRDYIKEFTRVCNAELKSGIYNAVRNYLFQESYKLNADQINELSHVLTLIFDLRKQNNAVVNKITAHLISQLENLLQTGQFNKTTAKNLTEQLFRLALYKNLFPDELNTHKEQSAEELSQIFQSKFPPDIVEDENTMSVLTLLSNRIEHIDNHLIKFKHVAQETIKILNRFFTLELPPELKDAPNHQKLQYRKNYINNYVNQLPKNIEIRKHLVSQGYHETFWEKDIWIEADIENRRNIEENYKSSLLGIYGEYIDILKTLYPEIKTLTIDSEEIPIEKIFCDDHRISLSIEDLKSRRNVVLKAIDKKIKIHPQKSFLTNRKLSLLAREEKLDADVEQQRQQEALELPQKKHYWCRLNNTFFNKAACCGKPIVGCYAPDGDHAEKPLENALKANVTFISLFEENKESSKGMSSEIENVEVLFTDQGLYIYKLYSNGHPYDTSLVWALFFKALVESNLIPAIIIPKQFPNNRTFNMIESFVPSQLSGSPITFRDDFFDEMGVQSYYDFKAEKIKIGDIVLNSQNIHLLKLPSLNTTGHSESQRSRTLLRRSNNAIGLSTSVSPAPKVYHLVRKDLAGLILTRVILKIKTDPRFVTHSDKAEACARFLSQYINLYIEKGVKDYDILTLGFDLDQYTRRKRVKKGNKVPLIQSQEEKETFIQYIVEVVQEELRKFYNSKPKLKALFYRERELFFELQNHLQNVVKNLHRDPKDFYETERIDLQRQNRQERNRQTPGQTAIGENCSPLDQQQVQQEFYERRPIRHDVQTVNVVPTRAIRIILTSEDIEKEQQHAKHILTRIQQVQREASIIVKISDLNKKLQYQVMKWIFGNEDRVWRDRGGRPGEETLQTFINFVTITQPADKLNPNMETNNNEDNQPSTTKPNTGSISNSNSETKEKSNESKRSNNREPTDKEETTEMRSDHYGRFPFGGYVIFSPRSKRSNLSNEKEFDIDEFNPTEVLKEMSTFNLNDIETLERVDIVGYCVGDWVGSDKFEIVTAWTHPHFRRLGFAQELYQRTMSEIKRLGGTWLTCDVVEHSLETIISSSPSLSFLKKLGLFKLCVPYRKKSYTADCRDGKIEQFEKYVVNVKWVLLGNKLWKLKDNVVYFVHLVTLNLWKENSSYQTHQHLLNDPIDQIIGII